MSNVKVLKKKVTACCDKMEAALKFDSDIFVKAQDYFALFIKQPKRERQFEIDYCPFCGKPLSIQAEIEDEKKEVETRLAIWNDVKYKFDQALSGKKDDDQS